MPAKKRIPKYRRSANPPAMRMTERDLRIIEAVHAYDGMLGFSQLQRMFFTGESQAKQRLMLLYQNKYLNRPSEEQRRRLPDMIYWLDKRGAALIASLNSVPVEEFPWRKEPRWFQVDHDLAVNDFRLAMEQACRQDTRIELEQWTPESEFWAYPDKVSYTYQDREVKRNIRPDGYFMLSTDKLNLRYLLEIDRSTEDHPRIYREKILPGMAYLKSGAYQERFGHRSGRWLVVTTSERRIANMIRQARSADTKGIFFFTTFDSLSPDTILHAPIWRRADREGAVPLIFLD